MNNIVDKAAKARGIVETVQEVRELPDYVALALWAAQSLLQEIETEAEGAQRENALMCPACHAKW